MAVTTSADSGLVRYNDYDTKGLSPQVFGLVLEEGGKILVLVNSGAQNGEFRGTQKQINLALRTAGLDSYPNSQLPNVGVSGSTAIAVANALKDAGLLSPEKADAITTLDRERLAKKGTFAAAAAAPEGGWTRA